ncbi:MAG: PolC-type DNA polymerase III, partial [Clostridium celatum]|nr:PolC-type DNA polymerase III [Clostridium celatum]
MSKDIIKKLTLEINKQESLEDKELKIIKFQLLRKSMILKVILRGKEKLAIEEEELIKNIICRTLMIKITVEIVFYRDASDITLEEVIKNHWIECTTDTLKKTPLCKTLLMNCRKEVTGNKVVLYNGYEKLTDHLKAKDGVKSLENSINAMFGITCKIEVKFDPAMEI